MFRPRSRYSRTSSVKRRPSQTSQTLDDLGHEPEARVGLAQAVAVRAGALGVRAEQRGLDAVRLRERRPDRVEDAGVGRRVGAPRAADRGLVDDRHRRVGPGQAAVDQRALAGAGDAGHRDEHAERHVDRDVLEVVEPGVPDRDRAARRPRLGLELLADVEVAAGGRPRARRGRRPGPRTRSVPPCGPAPGPMSTTWSAIRMTSGSCSTTRTVLPLSRRRWSSAFIRSTSWACSPIVGSSKT